MPAVKSARGTIVDFDLLRIQQSLLNATPSDVVVERKEAIEDKIAERRARRLKARQERAEREKEIEQDVVVEEVKAEKPKRTRVLQQEDSNE